MNEEEKTWRSYGLSQMTPDEILTFGSTQLTMRLVKGCLSKEMLSSESGPPQMLEIGAGTCHVSYLIKTCRNDQTLVVAADVSAHALRAGKKLQNSFHVTLDGYICCDSAKLPFKDQSFGFVFGSAVLHHLKNPSDTCEEIERVLRPGGKYVGMEGVVNKKLRPLVRVMTGAHYRITREGVREDMYDLESWSNMFSQVGMLVAVNPLIFPAAYRELIGTRVVPRAYRPRYKLRYPYEKILDSLPKHLARTLLRTLLPGTVVIRAKRHEDRARRLS